MEKRFSDLRASSVFKHTTSVLDVSVWPLASDDDNSFGDAAVDELLGLFKDLPQQNGCDVGMVLTEWDTLKAFVLPLIASNKETGYLGIWKRVFTNDFVKTECVNIIHLIEILFMIIFTNAKVERMLSRMKRVKSDWRTRLHRDTLDDLLRIGEEGPSIQNFNPDTAIDKGIHYMYSSSCRHVKKPPRIVRL